MSPAQIASLRIQAVYTRRLAVLLFKCAEDVVESLDRGDYDQALDTSLRATFEAAELQAEAEAEAAKMKDRAQ